MWADTFTIVARGFRVGLAFDDAATSRLVRADLDAFDPVDGVERVDYAIQTTTSAPDAAVRSQPALLHGRRVKLRSRSTERLHRALLYELERVTRAPGTSIWLRAAAMVRDDRALLLPLQTLGGLSERALAKHDLRPVDSSDVELRPDGLVAIGATLGEEPETARLVGWWLGASVFGHDTTTPARRVASALAHVVDAGDHDASALLRSLADVATTIPIELTPDRPGNALVKAATALFA